MDSYYPWPNYMAYPHPMADQRRFPEPSFYHVDPQNYANQRFHDYPRSAEGFIPPRSAVNPYFPTPGVNSNVPTSRANFNSPRSTINYNSPSSMVNSNTPRSAVYSNAPRSVNNYSTPRRARFYNSPRSASNYNAPRSALNYNTPTIRKPRRKRNRYLAHFHQVSNPSNSEEVSPTQGAHNNSSYLKETTIVQKAHGNQWYTEKEALAKTHLNNQSYSGATKLAQNVHGNKNYSEGSTFAQSALNNQSYSQKAPIAQNTPDFRPPLDVMNICNVSETLGVPNQNIHNTEQSFTNNTHTSSQDQVNLIRQSAENSCLSNNDEATNSLIGISTNSILNGEVLLNRHETILFEKFIENPENLTLGNSSILVTDYKAGDYEFENPTFDDSKLINELIEIASELEQSSDIGVAAVPEQQDMVDLSLNNVAALEPLDIQEDPILTILDGQKLDELIASYEEQISASKGKAIHENLSPNDKIGETTTNELNAYGIITNYSQAQQTDLSVCIDAQTQVSAKDFETIDASKNDQTDISVCVDAQTQVTKGDFWTVYGQVDKQSDESQKDEIILKEEQDSINVEVLQCKMKDEPKEKPKSCSLINISLSNNASSSIESDFSQSDAGENSFQFTIKGDLLESAQVLTNSVRNRIQKESLSSNESEFNQIMASDTRFPSTIKEDLPESTRSIKKRIRNRIQMKFLSSSESDLSQFREGEDDFQMKTEDVYPESSRVLRKRKITNNIDSSFKRESKLRKKI